MPISTNVSNYTISHENTKQDVELGKISSENTNSNNYQTNTIENKIETVDFNEMLNIINNTVVFHGVTDNSFKNKYASYTDRITNFALAFNILDTKDIEKNNYNTSSETYVKRITFTEGIDGTYEELLEKYKDDPNCRSFGYNGEKIEILLTYGISLNADNGKSVSIVDESDGSITIHYTQFDFNNSKYIKEVTINNAENLSMSEINNIINN